MLLSLGHMPVDEPVVVARLGETVITLLGHVPISGVGCQGPCFIPKWNGTTKEAGERGLESMAGRQNPQLLQFSGDIRGEFKDLEFVSQVQDGNGNLGIVWNR